MNRASPGIFALALSLSLSLAAAACGGGGSASSTPDAGSDASATDGSSPGADAGMRGDGGTAAHPDSGTTPHLDGGNPSSDAGSTGSTIDPPPPLAHDLAAGAPCAQDAECAAAGRCVASLTGPRCAAPCGAGSACATGFSCDRGACVVSGLAALPAPGSVADGHPCALPSDCVTGSACVRVSDVASVCLARCGGAGECAGGLECFEEHCVPARANPVPLGGACAADHQCAGTVDCISGFCTHRCGERFGGVSCEAGTSCRAFGEFDARCVPASRVGARAPGEPCLGDFECGGGATCKSTSDNGPRRCAVACDPTMPAGTACGGGLACAAMADDVVTDTIIRILDSTGRQLAEDDDASNDTLFSRLDDVALAAAGTYFVEVSLVATDAGEAGLYHLTVRPTGPGAAAARAVETEPNDTRAQANAVTLPVEVIASIAVDAAGAPERDLFQFTVPAAMRVQAVTSFPFYGCLRADEAHARASGAACEADFQCAGANARCLGALGCGATCGAGGACADGSTCVDVDGGRNDRCVADAYVGSVAGGGLCDADFACVTGARCVPVRGVGVCAQACSGTGGCAADARCVEVGSGTGTSSTRCIPSLVVGTARPGDLCAAAFECETSACRKLVEGTAPVCTQLCGGAAVACPASFACSDGRAADGGAWCTAVPDSGDHPFAARCAIDEECATGLCVAETGGGRCARGCEASSECATLEVRPPGPPGGICAICEDDNDCFAGGVCDHDFAPGTCTQPCATDGTTQCPPGAFCLDFGAGPQCYPDRGCDALAGTCEAPPDPPAGAPAMRCVLAP